VKSVVAPVARALERFKAHAHADPQALDALLALGLYVAVTLGVTSQTEAQHEAGKLIGAVANLALCGPLVLRRRAPMVVLGVVAAVGVAVALWPGPTGGEVAVLVALATAVSWEDDLRRTWLAVAVTLAGLGAALLVVQPEDPFLQLAACVAALTAAVAIGAAVRARREQRAAMAERVARLERERAQEGQLAAAAERTRIARELHDVVAHNVSVMIALADGAEQTVDTDPARARSAIGQVAATGREALAELRDLLGVLRTAGDNALERAPQPGIHQLEELVERVRDAGLQVRLHVTGAPAAVSPLVDITVYRIAQEALTNALRHGRATSTAEVSVRWSNGAVELEVCDDGRVDHAANPPRSGRGLVGMRERARMHDASLDAGPRPHGGWRVFTRIPLRDERAASA
jgi:signal transduction histidine kinase